MGESAWVSEVAGRDATRVGVPPCLTTRARRDVASGKGLDFGPARWASYAVPRPRHAAPGVMRAPVAGRGWSHTDSRTGAAEGGWSVRAARTGRGDSLMGSVVKKRRKRMAKKKHRKLLRKTRVQRRRLGK